MNFIDSINIIGFLLGLASIIFGLFLYFKDPIKRWRFLGYRPTAICGIYDPDKKSLLIVDHIIGGWQLIQTGILGDNLMEAIETGIEKEINVNSSNLDFRYITILGTIKNHRDPFQQIYSLNQISLYARSIGKGYIGALVVCKEETIKKIAKPGIDINGIKFIKLNKAVLFLSKNKNIDKREIKMKYYKKLIMNIEEHIELKERKIRLSRIHKI